MKLKGNQFGVKHRNESWQGREDNSLASKEMRTGRERRQFECNGKAIRWQGKRRQIRAKK